MEYGPNARDVEADLEPEEINKRMELFIQKSVNIASKEKFKLENKQRINLIQNYGRKKGKKD